jgi:hypothetical protein
MQMIVAGLMALTAMGASILADVDPMTVVARGGIAFVCGLVLTGVWTSVVNPQAKEEKPKKKAKEKPAEVESKASAPEPEPVVEAELEEAA